MIKNKVVAVDFDGTITDRNCFPNISGLRPHCVEALQTISNQGNKIFLWTCRTGNSLKEAVNFCLKNGIALCGINESPYDNVNVGGRKPIADFYIDDRNMFAEINWEKIEDYFKNASSD